MSQFIREACRILGLMVPNCFRYFTDCRCEVCDMNFFLVDKKKCCSMMPNVKNYNINCNPSQCATNFRISVNELKCVKMISNCVSYGENDICIACESDFSLSENQCIEITNTNTKLILQIVLPIIAVIILIIFIILYFKNRKSKSKVASFVQVNKKTDIQTTVIEVESNTEESLDNYLKKNNEPLKLPVKVEIAKTICRHIKNLHSINKYYEEFDVYNIKISNEKPVFGNLKEKNLIDTISAKKIKKNIEMVIKILEIIFKKELINYYCDCFPKKKISQKSPNEKIIRKLFKNNESMDYFIGLLDQIKF